MYVRLTHKLADLIGLVANTSVNGNDLHLRSISLVDLLEAGHLSAARNTVGRPELEVYRLLAIVVNDVDRAAINRAQRDVGRRLANQLGQLRIFGDVSDIARFGGRVVGQRIGGIGQTAKAAQRNDDDNGRSTEHGSSPLTSGVFTVLEPWLGRPAGRTQSPVVSPSDPVSRRRALCASRLAVHRRFHPHARPAESRY